MSIRLLVCLVAAINLCGCIYLDRSTSYRKAGSLEPLRYPPDLPALESEPLYPIPAVKPRTDTFVDVASTGAFEVPRPEPIDVEKEQAKVKLQRVGDERWILLEAPASQVWPLTQSFLVQRGIRVARSHPATGLIETDWIEFNNDPATRSRYRLNIEQGIRPDTTEIHVLHARRPAEAQVEDWPEQSVDPQLADAMLEDLANDLALEINNRSASLLGQVVGGQIKAELFMDGKEPALRLRLNEARATATVGHALRTEPFKHWGSIAEGKAIYFNYLDPAADGGWFDFLRADPPEQAPHPVEQVFSQLAADAAKEPLFQQLPATGSGAALTPAVGYLLVLTAAADGGFVANVRDMRGKPLAVQAAKQMLTQLRRDLL